MYKQQFRKPILSGRTHFDGHLCCAMKTCSFLRRWDNIPPSIRRRGLSPGGGVSVVPDDTGCGNPTMCMLLKIRTGEVVMKPHERAELDVRVHFSRQGFVVKTMDGSEL